MNEESSKSVAAKREEETLAFWKEHSIFEKSLAKNDTKDGKGKFVFYDGPPFATGLPHYGHILASAIKDAIPRYQTMRGFHVERKWGWDCHGLPIENLVEKELQVSGKKQIEALGVDVFNEKARSMVLHYVHEWKRTVDRMARWVDFDGSYKTMDNTYMESVWWALKKIYVEDGLVYESTKVLPYCPRCETPIANSEIAMDNSYKDITDISVYVKFQLVDEPDTYLLAWTTTPWTLPGNTALAINKDVVYAKVKKDNVFYILAKELVEKVLKSDFEEISVMKGEELIGKSYLPVFDYYKNIPMPDKERIWKIWHADFVTIEKGTGIAHEAPAFGEEDMFLALEHELPMIKHVGPDGKFVAEVTDFAGTLIKPKPTKEEPTLHQSADIEIIKKLAHQGSLFAKEKIVHSYPHCFRCETPLYYYAIPAWFIEIQSLKTRLAELNENINWIPSHLKEGRFKKSMESAPDWNISRNRFWASPLPFWKCKSCGKVEVLGGVKDIKEKMKRNTYHVMRHGEADHLILDILSSKVDNPHHLTELGIEQATNAGQLLKEKKIDLIIASPFVRTKETADIVAEQLNSGVEILYDKRIGELDFGDFNLHSREDYFRQFETVAERLTKRLPNGENLKDVQARIADFLYDIDAKYEGKNILIVTHEGPATTLCAVAEGADDKKLLEFWGMDRDFISPAQVISLDFAFIPHNKMYELDLHRPYIDAISWKCTCGDTLIRTPEVIDCWFESGSMPFASKHFPFENEEAFKQNFPADFVAEYIAQTRTWFYYMHVVSTVLFDSNPFKNVVTTGNVLAEDGQKMSKSKKNFPDPWILFDKYGVDPIRYYLLSSPIMKSEDLNFSEKGVDEVNKKIILRLQNVVSFYEMYATENDAHEVKENQQVVSTNILDQWILARLNQITKEMTESFDAYELDKAARPIVDFVDDLSTWYLRRSRERFKGDDEADKKAALLTTKQVLLTTAKLIAPIMPFLAEEVFQKVRGANDSESVHLENWPTAQLYEAKQLDAMALARAVVEAGLFARSKAGIKVRQPLGEFKFETAANKSFTLNDYAEILNEELNVKSVVESKFEIEDELNIGKVSFDVAGVKVSLDPTLTPELKSEGDMRELLRAIQDLRKNTGLSVSDRVVLRVETSEEGKALIAKYKTEISKPAGLTEIEFGEVDGEEIKIDTLTFKLAIDRSQK